MKGGYKVASVFQILNAVLSYVEGKISFAALRVYFASLEMLAIREAAERSRKKIYKKGRGDVLYKKSELESLCKLTSVSVRRALTSLEKENLLQFSKEKIIFNEVPLSGVEDFIKSNLSGRSGKRLIPIPRNVIRLLASTSRPALLITLISYMLRSLSFDRKTKAIKTKGTVKSSWIASAFSVSLRAVKAARKKMISLGIIENDTGSYQRKLNRDGAYFKLNIGWKLSTKAVDNSFSKCAKSAPPQAQNSTEIAPPVKEIKTSYESKNQKTKSGVSKQKGEGTLPAPNIRNINRYDLESFSRMETLYYQAVKKGIVDSSESTALNFLAAAIRAKRTKAINPVKVFFSIIKRKSWEYITQEHEDLAREAFIKYRKDDPMRFRALT